MDLFDVVALQKKSSQKDASELQAELAEHLRKQQEPRSVGERLLEGVSAKVTDKSIQEARERKPEPETTKAEPALVATRMEPRPDHSQPAPMMGPGNFTNPRAWRPPQPQQLIENLVQSMKPTRETLIDALQRELKEARASMTPEDHARVSERELKHRQSLQKDTTRGRE